MPFFNHRKSSWPSYFRVYIFTWYVVMTYPTIFGSPAHKDIAGNEKADEWAEVAGKGARHPWGGMAELQLQRPVGSACDAPPAIPREPQAGDLREEVGRSAPVGWRPDLQEEVLDAEESEGGRHGSWEHQEARLAVLPAEDGTLSHRTIPALGQETA